MITNIYVANIHSNNKTCCTQASAWHTGWPNKVSHYQESSLNHIKNRQWGHIFH